MSKLFHTLVDRHHQQTYAIALRMLGNSAEAEDATQEAYEKLWKHLPKLNEFEAKPWLMRVLRNLCIDKLRAKKPLDILEDDAHCANEQSQPTSEFEHAQLSGWLQHGISQLKEPYRTLISLLHLRQKSVKEAAIHLDMNENQVKVYAHRARKQLRAHLQDLELAP